MPTASSGALPLGTTFASELARLEATQEGRAALARAKINYRLRTLMDAGEMSEDLNRRIVQAKNVDACERAGIDVNRILVVMAKAQINPKPTNGDWNDSFPNLATREDVVAAIAPYLEAMGEKKLAQIFFPELDKQIHHYVAGRRKPSFGSLCTMLDFFTKEAVNGRPISQWSEEHANVFLAKCQALGVWDPFDPFSDPFQDIRDYASFKRWFDDRVPATHVEFVAQFTGLTKDLLDRWRREVSRPSGEMLVKLLSGVREHKPEWLRVDDGQGASSLRPASEPSAPTTPPARKNGEVPKRTPKLSHAARAVQPSITVEPPPDEDRSPLATAAQEVAELLELLAPKLRLMAQCAAQPEAVPGFTPISEPVPVPEPPTTPVPQASDDDAIISGRRSVGEQGGKIRFLLTSDTFLPFNGAFTKGEMADTRTLLRELARRLALVNAKTGDAPAKDAIVNELAADLVALAAQLRGLDFREVATLIGDADMLAKEN